MVAGMGALAAAGALGCALPRLAHADELTELKTKQYDIQQQIIQMRGEVETAADNYQKALEEHTAAENEVAEAQKLIDVNNKRIGELQDRMGDRMRLEYKTGLAGIYDLLFGASTFEQFVTQIDMYDYINKADADMVQETKDLRAQNEEAKRKKEEQEQIARSKMDEANRIKTEAEQKTAELQSLYDSLDAQAKELLEVAQAQAMASADWPVDIIGNPRNIEPFPDIIDYALSRVGCPYVWGAAGPDTFDCSGLVIWAFAQAGIKGMPHYTGSLYELAHARGAIVNLTDVKPGDILFRPGHCGIALADGGLPYVHAPNTGALVRTTDSLSYSKFVCGLRFPH